VADSQGVRVAIPADHPAFAGHFPGDSMLPGVVLLAHAQEVLLATLPCGPWIAAGAVLHAVKFLAPVRPGADLEVRWTAAAAGHRVDVQVRRHGPGDGPDGVLACTAQIGAPPTAS